MHEGVVILLCTNTKIRFHGLFSGMAYWLLTKGIETTKLYQNYKTNSQHFHRLRSKHRVVRRRKNPPHQFSDFILSMSSCYIRVISIKTRNAMLLRP